MGEEEMIKYIYEKVFWENQDLKRANDIIKTENRMLKNQNEMLIQILNRERK